MKRVATQVRPPPSREKSPGAIPVNYDREIGTVLNEPKINAYNGLVKTAECFKKAPHSGVIPFMPDTILLQQDVDVATALRMLEEEKKGHPPFSDLRQLIEARNKLVGKMRIIAFGQFLEERGIRSYPYIGINGSEIFISLLRETFGTDKDFYALVDVQQVPLR